MTTTFDKAAYDEILDDIETYLGYLKGNELVWKYLMNVKNKVDAKGMPFQHLDDEYSTPCPDPAFRCQPSLYGAPAPDGVDWDIEAKIRAGADASWRQGPLWAAGIAGQARAITEQITSPDVAELDAALKTMTDEVLPPLELLMDSNADLPEPYRIPLPDENSVDGDWANLNGLLNSWHGTAAEEFRTLYDSLDTCIGVYAYVAGAAALEVTAASDIIASSQQGLLISVKDIRSTVTAQLEKWCEVGQPPTDQSKFPTWIFDLLPITKLYKGARLLIDGVTDPKKIIGVLSEIKMTIVGKTAQKDRPQGGEQLFKAADSEEVLSSLTTMLRETYLHDFVDALTDLSPSPAGSLDFLHTLQDTGRWAPPTVSEGSVRGNGDTYPT